jgi:hypothetical protein
MQEKIGKLFVTLGPAFTRKATFSLFVVAVTGIMLRSDSYGVTSIVRALALDPSAYPCLLHLFHSSAWNKDRLLLRWMKFLVKQGVGDEINGRLVLVGDHTKQPKDGRKMPGVTTLRQDSETSSKPSYFRGHHWGFIAMVSCRLAKYVAIPLWGEIHRDSEEESRSVRLLGKAVELSASIGKPFYLVLDAFFSVGPVLAKAQRSNGSAHVLVRAKKNVTAYGIPISLVKRGRGQPRKYGRKKKLIRLFSMKSSVFEHADLQVYQKFETVKFMTLDLMWKPVKAKVRFFLVETSRGQIILLTTDLSLRAEDAIRMYCARAKIETAFDVFKNLLGGMSYRFWSKYLAPVSRRPTKNTTPPPSSKPEKTALTLTAIENFVAATVVAHGILQYLSLSMPEPIINANRCWMRTPPRNIPSEFVTKHAVSACVRELLTSSAKNWIASLIRKRQRPHLALPPGDDIFEDASGF